MPDRAPSSASPLDEAVIALLDRLRPGDRLALASASAPLPEAARSLAVDATLEAIAEAVFSVLPISRAAEDPLALWAASADDPEVLDLASAVRGLAADGSGRQLGMASIDDAVVLPLDAVLRVPWTGTPFAFLVRVGGGPPAETAPVEQREPAEQPIRRVLAGVC